MTLREISALVSAILVVIGTIWYIYHVRTSERIRPVMATWIVTSCGTVLSLITYWTSPGHSLVSNVYNAMTVITINAILYNVIKVNKQRKIPLEFNLFQKFCLWASGGIVVYWAILVFALGRTGIVPNVFLQILMFVGYLMTVQKLLSAERNTEPTATWWLIFAAAIVGLCTGIISKNSLSILFAARTAIGTLMLICCMLRLDRRERRQQKTMSLQAEKLRI